MTDAHEYRVYDPAPLVVHVWDAANTNTLCRVYAMGTDRVRAGYREPTMREQEDRPLCAGCAAELRKIANAAAGS